MGRISTKEDKTVYQLAREEKELSREKAAEITGLSTTTIDFGRCL